MMNSSLPRMYASKKLYIVLLSLITFCITSKAELLGPKSGENDTSFPLMIEAEWDWNTFMGSSADDRGRSIVVDETGNVYVVGYGSSWGSPVNEHAGWVDAFAAKLNSSGELLWHTFMGGAEYDDYGIGIAVDGSGNVYVTGESDASWGSPVNAHAGGYYDAFAVKLDSNGVRLWHTFLGSSSDDRGKSITVDGNGDVYITGYSDATWGSPVNAYAGKKDAFTVKLDSSGVLQWNTFMGSSRWDEGSGIAVDGSGNVYIAGHSSNPWGSPVNPYAGGFEFDAFAVKLNSSGVLQWNTFMGSTYEDESNDIAIDGSGNVYVAGFSEYQGWGSPVNDHSSGFSDAFAAKLDNNGVRQWNTFMGSSDNDAANGIAVDGSGNVYLAGESKLTWGAPVNAFVGDGFEDAFACKLNGSGERIWNSFMGGADRDYGKGIVVDGNGKVYVTGTSYVYEWGTPINPHAGWNNDVFVVKMDYSDITDVETVTDLSASIKLSQNYPNPFSNNTIIEYSLHEADHVTLKVYNMLGKEVRSLVNEYQTQGNYAIEFDGIQLPGGIYLYELNFGNNVVRIKKMTILK